TLQDSGILTDAGALVGFFVLVGYGAKLAIEWFRGNKSVETEWRGKALQDAAASHGILKGMINTLREQVDSPEEDLRESKAREAEVLAAHRNEVAQYKVRIRELESSECQLRSKIAELERELSRLSQALFRYEGGTA